MLNVKFQSLLTSNPIQLIISKVSIKQIKTLKINADFNNIMKKYVGKC